MLTNEIFSYFSKIIFDKSGMIYTEEESYRLEKRLREVATALNIDSIEDLFKHYQKYFNQTLSTLLIDAATNNETSFFRDARPFDILVKILMPEFIKKNIVINIWSAACSSGQEPYSLAMMILENFSHLKTQIKFNIWATDICTKILKKAEEGVYSDLDISRGLSAEMKTKYFREKSKNQWEIVDQVKKMVTFNQFNLIDGSYPYSSYHIIFCRNVLIYQNVLNKEKILNKMASSLKEDGRLFLGAGESYLGMQVDLKQELLNGTVMFAKDIKIKKIAS